MAVAHRGDELLLVDLPDIFVSGIIKVEHLRDGNVRIYFYVDRPQSGTKEVVACLIVAASSLSEMAQQMLATFASNPSYRQIMHQ